MSARSNLGLQALWFLMLSEKSVGSPTGSGKRGLQNPLQPFSCLQSLIAFQVTEAALVPYYCQNDSISAILRFLGCAQP